MWTWIGLKILEYTGLDWGMDWVVSWIGLNDNFWTGFWTVNNYAFMLGVQFRVPPAGGSQLFLPTAQAGWWSIPTLSQPNLGI